MLDQVVAHLKPYIEKTPGPLDPGVLGDAERALHDSLPPDLQALLSVWNGATFKDDPGLEYSTGIEGVWDDDRRAIGSDVMNTLFGFSEQAPEHLAEYYAGCLEEEFLPRGLVPIGHGLQHSLLLISIRERDPGAVFYWEWYWQYPWYLPFFERRIMEAWAPFDDAAREEGHPDHDALVEAANSATVVQLADALFPWLLSLKQTEPLED